MRTHLMTAVLDLNGAYLVKANAAEFVVAGLRDIPSMNEIKHVLKFLATSSA